MKVDMPLNKETIPMINYHNFSCFNCNETLLLGLLQSSVMSDKIKVIIIRIILSEGFILIMLCLMFDLYYDATVQHISNYAMRTTPTKFFFKNIRFHCYHLKDMVFWRVEVK